MTSKYNFIEESFSEFVFNKPVTSMALLGGAVGGISSSIRYLIDRFGTSENDRRRLIDYLKLEIKHIQDELKSTRSESAYRKLRMKLIKNKAMLNILENGDLTQVRKAVANSKLKKHLIHTALCSASGAIGATIGKKLGHHIINNRNAQLQKNLEMPSNGIKNKVWSFITKPFKKREQQ